MDRYGQETESNTDPGAVAITRTARSRRRSTCRASRRRPRCHLVLVDRKPDVQISAELTRQRWREVRQRTTITHECAHAIQHAPLWRGLGPGPFDEGPIAQSCRCEYTEDLLAQWDEQMERQARYMSGGLLMPKSRVWRLARQLERSKGLQLPVDLASPSSVYLIEHVVIAFHVSRDAATVRLKQLGLLK